MDYEWILVMFPVTLADDVMYSSCIQSRLNMFYICIYQAFNFPEMWKGTLVSSGQC